MPAWNKWIRSKHQTPEGEIEVILRVRSYSLGREASMEINLNGVLVASAKENWETGEVEIEGKKPHINWVKLNCINIDHNGHERLSTRVRTLRKGRND
jgi:hypothetical protein